MLGRFVGVFCLATFALACCVQELPAPIDAIADELGAKKKAGDHCSNQNKPCAQRSDPCLMAECSQGRCIDVPKPGGTSCNDGNACSSGDVCSAGSCTG